jgi:hypothetical protein
VDVHFRHSRIELLAQLQIVLVARHPALQRLHHHHRPPLRQEDRRALWRRRRSGEEAEGFEALCVGGGGSDAGDVGGELVLESVEPGRGEDEGFGCVNEGEGGLGSWQDNQR